ncbi:Transposon Tf2-1 polyprotein [Quillaja saponaria]|uniref:Transposon Tf2-1 polyprotein n=1 Tax=Quillaja saponaria TaxID=32244 RepID=A0AAD7PJB7_QUISA|nr:Transposon Tf2-1 polyprotein [Quillaja saponaria]
MVAQKFVQDVVKLHGLPSSILSDKDKVFIHKFWQELFKVQGTTLAMSSAYHPQTDGQSESLEMYFRCFVAENPSAWSKSLPWAEYDSFQNQNPWRCTYGTTPPTYLSWQNSLALRKNQKLGMKYFGPCQITERIGAVAYKLLLPNYARIHPVFHISVRKKCIGDPTTQTYPLPALFTNLGLVFFSCSCSPSSWNSSPEQMGLLQRLLGKLLFPSGNIFLFHLEDKVTVDEEGNSMTVGSLLSNNTVSDVATFPNNNISELTK